MSTQTFLINFIAAAFIFPMAFQNAYASPEKLNSGKIAFTVETINNGEIELAKLALKRGNTDVKNFAKMMIDQHSTSNADFRALEKNQNIKPSASELSAKLNKEVGAKKVELTKLTGSDFNKKYIDSQVAMHAEALNLIDQQLLPSAENSPLRDLLTKTRATVATHQEHAIDLQSKIENKG